VSSNSQNLTGKRMGKYKLERLIGSGGMADVYQARDGQGKPVAVKVLSAALARNPDGVTRFRREAEAARRLDHPHVVKVLDVGQYRGHYYIVMEKLRGQSFRRLVGKGNDPEQILTMLSQVAQALAYAHASGIVHRDIKPDNVLLDRKGMAKVADFGLARVIDASSFTSDGALIGTVKYMSPEQAQGKRAEAASDVYSMGVMIYEAITGELPFASDTHHGFLFQHAVKVPDKPRVRRGFHPGLGKLCLRCLEKAGDRRPSMDQVVAELEAARSWRPMGWRLLVAAIWIAVAAVVAGVVAVLVDPAILDPLARDWFGGPAVGALQDAVRHLHGRIAHTLPIPAGP